MMTEREVRERLGYHEENLLGWSEPGGFLLPTEPDPEQRAVARAELRGAIYALKIVLGEPT